MKNGIATITGLIGTATLVIFITGLAYSGTSGTGTTHAKLGSAPMYWSWM